MDQEPRTDWILKNPPEYWVHENKKPLVLFSRVDILLDVIDRLNSGRSPRIAIAPTYSPLTLAVCGVGEEDKLHMRDLDTYTVLGTTEKSEQVKYITNIAEIVPCIFNAKLDTAIKELTSLNWRRNTPLHLWPTRRGWSKYFYRTLMRFSCLALLVKANTGRPTGMDELVVRVPVAPCPHCQGRVRVTKGFGVCWKCFGLGIHGGLIIDWLTPRKFGTASSTFTG